MTSILEIGKRAKAASFIMAEMSDADKKDCLLRVADALVDHADRIIEENKKDVALSEERGVSPAMIDRLKVDLKKIEAMAEGVRQVAELPDPNNELLETITRPNGMTIEKRRVPIGVIGIIYESRPNVTADAFALTFRSGNACILRGGSDAIN